jgi:hypothetical protein
MALVPRWIEKKRLWEVDELIEETKRTFGTEGTTENNGRCDLRIGVEGAR